MTLQSPSESQIEVLAATNRVPDASRIGYTNEWAGRLVFERFTVSVPLKRDGTTIEYPHGKVKPEVNYFVKDRKHLSKDEFVKASTAETKDGVVGVFVHGYNNSYQEAVFRTAQIAVDSKAPTGLVLFSWPSIAEVPGYIADRDATLTSRSDLTQLIRTLDASPNVKRIVLVGHSMGGFLTMETVRQFKLHGDTSILDKLVVVLAAPDIDFELFKSQMRDIGKMKQPITVLTSKADKALAASSFIAGERDRIGLIDVSSEDVMEASKLYGFRIVDITSLPDSEGLGHNRFLSLAKISSTLGDTEARKLISGSSGAYVFDASSSSGSGLGGTLQRMISKIR